MNSSSLTDNDGKITLTTDRTDLSKSYDGFGGSSSNKLRRRRSDRSKPKAGTVKKFTKGAKQMKDSSSSCHLHTDKNKLIISQSMKSISPQPSTFQSKTVKTYLKPVSASRASLNSSNVVQFANLLLAKHEANMKRREMEGIGYSLTESAEK